MSGMRIDPRIRARLVDIRRHAGLRRFRVLIAIALVMLAGVSVWGVLHSPLYDVDRIDALGATRYDQAELAETAGLREGQPIVFVDLARAAERIETLPWIDGATVTRDLPGSLTITVSERVAVAWIARPDGRVALLDDRAHVLEDVAQPPPGLPAIVTSAPVPDVGTHFAVLEPAATVAARWSVTARGGVETIAVDRLDLLVTMGDDTLVIFGPAVDVDAKMAALTAVLTHLGDQTVRYVDVAVPAAPTVGTLIEIVPEANGGQGAGGGPTGP
jgi:cell division protein FtsQ